MIAQTPTQGPIPVSALTPLKHPTSNAIPMPNLLSASSLTPTAAVRFLYPGWAAALVGCEVKADKL